MSIYSANRSGSMNLSQVRANESYNSSDLGRILYESEVNDMAFFEAILASDFREIQGLQEGTLLESEIKAMNEASIRTLLSSLKQRLVKFWGKIKAAFKDAMTKIAAYIMRDGKAFVKNFWNTYNKYNGWDGSKDIKRYLKRIDNELRIDRMASDIEDDIKAVISKPEHAYKDKTKNEILKMKLSRMLGEDIEPSDFVKKYVEKCENSVTITNADLEGICKAISDGSTSIKKLKDAESKAKNAIDKMGKCLTSAENKADNENSSKNVSTIVTMVGVGESFVTYFTKACIAVVKADIKSCRAALSAVMSDLKSNGTKKDKKALEESFILEAEDIMADIDDEIDAGDDTTAENEFVDEIEV